VFFLLAVTVRRDSATRLGYGFDHRVCTVGIAAVDPDRLRSLSAPLNQTLQPPTELGPSTLGDVSILPPALCRPRWGTWLYGARHAGR
jgi:hypothetical protein